MRIGIDIDGVLVDIERFIVDYGIQFCYENNIDYHIVVGEYDESKSLGLTKQQTELFWNQYLPYYCTSYYIRNHAKEVIDLLKKEHEIYIITARNEDGLPKEEYGQMQSLVEMYLENNQIEYNQLIFTKGSKLPYCMENKIDVMVEDSPFNVPDIATEIPVLCFDNSYNRKCEGDNITRVYSWYDVLSKIKKMKD